MRFTCLAGRHRFLISHAALSFLFLSLSCISRAQQVDWPVYGGSAASTHYSSLSQIKRGNVRNLQVAWSFDTGEEGGLQTNPIVVNGVLYGLTPSQKIFALDAATGKLLWKFDPGVHTTQPNRGLAYWSDGHDVRLLVGVLNSVYALNAATGQPIPTFGRNGRVDLREGLGREPASAQSIALTTPPVVFKDLFIVGGRNPESLPAPPGDVRAFDARTGKLRWAFHTIPHPGEFGYDTWPKDAWKISGAANNWAGMTVDIARGIVYVPTGSAAFDFYGPDRLGDNLFANCLIALNAATGERIWHFQGVRHDLWDRDFPSPPVLLTVHHDGQTIDAVAQSSKQGFIYLFDRTTGQPLFPIEYRDYPPSVLPGEAAARQQGLPTRPAPFSRQSFTEQMLTHRTGAIHQWALEKFKTFRNDGQFVPFRVGKDTVVFPGFDGGAEWGGSALDPDSAILYVNANDIAWTGALAETTFHKSAKAIYLGQCALCHGDNRQGTPPTAPSLLGIAERMSARQIAGTIQEGKGRMPGFPNLSDDQVYAVAEFLKTGKDQALSTVGPVSPSMKYHLTGYKRFLDPDGYPAVEPPWGTLNAINLNTGEYVWKIPLGEYPELAAQGMKNTGTENYGGPIVTAGGLLFIGATNYDKKFRAFDKSTGELLWETTLPFSGNATPATYSVDGRQFVVIAAGGGKDLRSKSGGVYVAFALPGKHSD
ncbi:MAG TPA: PQQ-binding-like beta-propeller repeat protein [Dongiaceae bacterium]|nr:PQQ-binding-like beta-propeller repeat protein [Dongiaceae bacterium]